MSTMTGKGVLLRTADGEEAVVALGDTLLLKNGFKATAHFWTKRGVHAVVQDTFGLSIETSDGLRVAAFDVGDGDIDRILEKARAT